MLCCINVYFSDERYLFRWYLNTFFTCISVQPATQLAAPPAIQPVAQPEANKENIPDDQHGSDDNDEDEIESEAENEGGDDESLVGTEDEEGLDLEGVFVEVPGKFK